jgi:hypothetical protein
MYIDQTLAKQSTCYLKKNRQSNRYQATSTQPTSTLNSLGDKAMAETSGDKAMADISEDA